MALLEIRVFGDPILRQEANEVTGFDSSLVRLARDMMETMRDAPGVGLAAPQVGVLKRLFTWEIPHEEEDGSTRREGGAVVNPIVTDTSEEAVEGEEGCLSFPGLFYPVERPLEAEVRWQDLEGEEHTARLEGFTARVWLHEIDHLDGILFIDHLARHDRRDAMKRMRAYRMEQELGADSGESGSDNLLLRGRSL